MASIVGSLYVSLTADVSAYGRNMKQAEAITTSTTAGIRRSAGATERSISSMQRTMSGGVRPSALIAAGRSFDSAASRANLLRGSVFALTAAFGGLGAALTTNVVARYFDTFTGLENQVRVVSKGSADLAAQLELISKAANNSRSSLSAVATLYSRMQKADPSQGPIKTLQRVETINKALQLGGATAQEAASAAIQFSQAIASNRLGGEELRAVLETPLGNELAKGLGVSIGEFRKMSIEGKLTSDVLYKSLDRISGSVNEKFAKSVRTIDQALTQADNAITEYAGHLNSTYGITRLITQGISGFANNLQIIIPLLASVGAGLGTLFAARRAGGIANTLAGPLTALTAMAAQKKEAVAAAKAELEVSEKARDVAKEQLALAQRSASSGGGLAAASTVKAYERDLAQLNKTSREYANNLQKQANLDAQIANMRGNSAATIKARETALARYNGLVSREIVLTQKLAQQRSTLDRSRSAMNASAASQAGAGITSAQAGYVNAAVGVQKSAANLSTMTKAATAGSIALSSLKVGFGSLAAFLGGPWGVALTTATGLLLYFGGKAQEQAERSRRALEIINEEIEKLRQKGQTTPQQDTSYFDAQIKAETERLKTVQAELASTRDQLVSGITRNVGEIVTSLRQAGDTAGADNLKRSISQVIEELKNGSLSITDFEQRLRALGVGEDIIKTIRNALGDVQNKGIDAEAAIKAIEYALTLLNGKRAQVEVDVKVNDPYGFITSNGEKLAKAYGQYGLGQQSNRDETIRLSQINARMADAADTGDKAKNTSAKIQATAQDYLTQGLAKTRVEAEALAKKELDLAEAGRQAAKSARGGAKDYENFTNKLAELKERAAGSAAGLTDTDQEVLQFAERLKNGSKMMREYIEAVKAGDLSKAPKELQEARDAFLQIGASKVADDIIQQYGKGAQVAGKFAEFQEKLNIAVARGDITAQQASVAFADFVGQFGEYQWINDLSSAITSFAESAITDFDNIEDAAMSLLKQIGKIILQATVLGPLEQSLKSAFASSATGSSSGGGFFSSLLSGFFGGGGLAGAALSPSVWSAIGAGAVGLFHEGGSAATPNSRRVVPMGMFANAPRYHSGSLRPGELPAILQKTETVLDQADARRNFRTLGRVADMGNTEGMFGGGVAGVELHLSPDLEARILDKSGKQSVRLIKDYDQTQLPSSVARVKNDPYKRG